MVKNLLLLLAIHRMSFLNTAEKMFVFNNCNSADNLPDLNILAELLGHPIKGKYNREKLISNSYKDISALFKGGINTLFIEDPEYPVLLKMSYNPPFLLFYKGSLPEPGNLKISIVGTRKATGRALRESYFMAFDFARSGVSLFSGLAQGIDTEVHKGALDGRTYTGAILGSGLNRIYPESNKKLALSIIDKGGALFSEYPPETSPSKYTFPERNRIISAMSRAIVIVEAPEKSGSLITADFALDEGRDLYVMNTNESEGNNMGNIRLIDLGAPVVNTASDVLREIRGFSNSSLKKKSIGRDLNLMETGRFLANRMLAELNENEICKEGIYCCL